MTRLTTRKSAKPRSELAVLLKFLRRRVDPDVRVLGSYARLPSRIGKRVTQEELAEAIGVSREWYAALESAATTRTSTGLLDRLAHALFVTPEERTRLFHLALPEMELVLRDDSVAILESFSRLRSLSKRLWAATSIEDILTTASEQVAEVFKGAVLIHTSRRRASGVWESRGGDDKQDRNDASKVLRELEDHVLPTESIDAVYLYPQLTSAGDTGTEDLVPHAIRREIWKECARQRLGRFTFVKARVRSRSDLIGSFCVMDKLGRHSYSALDRALLGTFAELTSLALS